MGAPGIDNIKNLGLLSKQELEDSLDGKFGKENSTIYIPSRDFGTK